MTDVTEVDYTMLDRMTESFSAERKIGKGGFATVFYGSLYLCDEPPQGWPDRLAIKVDKFKYNDEGNSVEQKSEWMKQADQAELKFCGSYTHPNLCRLYGFSVNGPSRCLVFEHCPGGSVRERLARKAMDKSASRPFPALGVGHRFRICAQLARALTYLHCGNGKAVFHRDVKPDNVLIDEGGNTKLADFGTVRQASGSSNKRGDFNSSGGATSLNTKMVVGTPHFMPPEYVTAGKVSAKTDTYALGMFIAVVLTNKQLTMEDTDFVYEFRDAVRGGWQALQRMLDPTAGTWDPTATLELAQIALSCAEQEYRKRAVCSGVLNELERLAKLPPTQVPARKGSSKPGGGAPTLRPVAGAGAGMQRSQFSTNEDANGNILPTTASELNTAAAVLHVMPPAPHPAPQPQSQSQSHPQSQYMPVDVGGGNTPYVRMGDGGSGGGKGGGGLQPMGIQFTHSKGDRGGGSFWHRHRRMIIAGIALLLLAAIIGAAVGGSESHSSAPVPGPSGTAPTPAPLGCFCGQACSATCIFWTNKNVNCCCEGCNATTTGTPVCNQCPCPTNGLPHSMTACPTPGLPAPTPTPTPADDDSAPTPTPPAPGPLTCCCTGSVSGSTQGTCGTGQHDCCCPGSGACPARDIDQCTTGGC